MKNQTKKAAYLKKRGTLERRGMLRKCGTLWYLLSEIDFSDQTCRI